MYKDAERRREYYRAYNAQWYKRNKKRISQRIQNRKRKIRLWFQNYKSNLKCEYCNENHIATLDFHHKDPSKKDASVSSALLDGWSKERILKEIKKCTVLCSNCHRKLHYQIEA